MSLFNSAYSGHRSPTYPLGDPVKYPQQDIPLGTLKLYTEQYISDIGRAIQQVTMSEDTYTTKEMSYAILNYIPKTNMIAIEFDLTLSECTIT